MKNLIDFIKENLNESKVDLDDLKSDIEDIMWDMWNNGYDSNRDRKEHFEAAADENDDTMIDAIYDKLTEDYDYEEDDLEYDEIVKIVAELADKIMND